MAQPHPVSKPAADPIGQETQQPRWLDFVDLAMRAGYVARGFVYGLIGFIALTSAGRTTGFLGALADLRGAPFNQPILFGLAVGLVCYSIWRGLDAIIDLAGHGGGFGWVERAGLFFIALLHLGLAWYAFRLAMGGAPFVTGSGSRAAGILRMLIDDPAGRVFIALTGLGTVSFGVYSVAKGAIGFYHRHMRQNRALIWLMPLMSFGLVARGVVLGMMGGFIIWAAWTLDPDVAGGYGETLQRIRAGVHGRVLLGIAGMGMIAFSFYCLCEAVFRVIPPRPAATDANRPAPAGRA